MLSRENQEQFAYDVAKEIMRKNAERMLSQPDKLAELMQNAYESALAALRTRSENEAKDFSYQAFGTENPDNNRSDSGRLF